MNPSLSRTAGWSLVFSAGLIALGLLVGVVLVLARIETRFLIVSVGLVSHVILLVVVYAVTVILAPFQGALSWLRAGMVALGLLIYIVASLGDMAGTTIVTDLETAAFASNLLWGFWVAWVSWHMWRHALLKGALPWIGVAYGVLTAITALLDRDTSNSPSILALNLLVYPFLFTWRIWFGLKLARGQVNVIDAGA